MLVSITEKCSMGCNHCMSDCKPDGQHMTKQTLIAVCNFLINCNAADHFVLTGGEPTEHPDFIEMMDIIFEKFGKTGQEHLMTITTNGFWCLEHIEEAKRIAKGTDNLKVFWQVSTDSRFYPKELPLTKRLWREPGFTLCPDCVEYVYPQGRARDNNLEWSAKASKCFNVRAITKQLPNPTIENIVRTLLNRMKFCTPSISIDGKIKLGESCLCPAVASIYDDEAYIIQKIKDFKCHGCDMINDNLPDLYKRFL